jgi:tetratricopeptide (TPR) repeat protein
MKNLRLCCGRWRFVGAMLAACAIAAAGCRPADSTVAPKAEPKAEASSALSPVEQRAIELIAQSVQLKDQGQLDAAIAKATEAIDLAPRQAAAYEARGLAYQGKKEYHRARSDFQEASTLLPTNGRPNYRLGILLLEMREFSQARSELSHATSKGYGTPLVILAMGDSMAGDNRFPEALQAYDRVIRTDPELARAYVQRGKVKLRTGEAAGAVADFTKARSLNLDVDDTGELRSEKRPDSK